MVQLDERFNNMVYAILHQRKYVIHFCHRLVMLKLEQQSSSRQYQA